MQLAKRSEKNLRVGVLLGAAVVLYIAALVGYMILR
jgi:hypothetical protein